MKTSESKLPICVVPDRLIHLYGDQERKRFDIRSYSELYEAWSLAEREPVALFISDSKAMGEGLFGLLTGLRLLQPDLIHVHVYQTSNPEDLVTLVNRSGVLRLVPADRAEEALSSACADALTVHLYNLRKDQEIERLRESNEQFEFMLRQSLLS